MDIAVIIGEIAYVSRAGIMDGIIDEAKKDGTNVILFTCEGFVFHYLKEFSSGEYNIFMLPELENYDGVIVELDSISNQKIRDYLIEKITKSRVPCVSINREIAHANVITFENESGFRKLVDHLIEVHNFTDIHYLSGPFGNCDAVQRLEIFRNSLHNHGLSIDDENIIEGNFNFDTGNRLAMQYIKGEKKLPQAIVCANDNMAIGLMEALKKNGIRVPKDVVVTGYDNGSLAAYSIPRLSTVDRGEYNGGALAYRKLIANINETETGAVSVINGTPVFAGSCGCFVDDSQKSREYQSAVDLKVNMDDSFDLLKGFTLGLANMENVSDFEQILEKYICQIGLESFYYCQCGTREQYYEELEVVASGKRVKRNMNGYQDMIWCPMAYENGKWSSYPVYKRSLLFPPESKQKKKVGYYIVMPVHQGEMCIGYIIIGNFKNRISGRVLQHLVLGIDTALGNSRKHDIMTTMLARINQKWQYDELTGLYNRSGFVHNAEKLVEMSASGQYGITVCFFDLDGLKKVNDTQGHEAGDSYIKLMAEILRNSADKTDVVSRYGGDEFVVLSLQKNAEEGNKKFLQLTGAIKEPVSASVGYIFDYVTSIEELNRLIEEADKRMYQYKKEKKRNRPD